MKPSNSKPERGQAILLFAFVLPLLLGAMALVIDLGWTYYLGKKAQTAADAAALASVAQAMQTIGAGGQARCDVLGCQAATACPGTGNLQAGCVYSQANGFTSGGDGGRQTVMIAAGTTSPAPNVPNVPVDYWVQVTVTQQVPQWFSGIFGASVLTPGARAMAAIRRVDQKVSISLLNRVSDCFVSALNIGLVCGGDLLALGGNRINARGGIHMASANPGSAFLPKVPAALVIGSARVEAPFTYLMGKGGVGTLLGTFDWSATPKNGFPDGDYFTDPMAGKGQPPMGTGLADRPVPGGVILGSLLGAPKVVPPGHYYATLSALSPNAPTGTPVTIVGNVIFSDGQNPPCGGFCEYVFHGGLVTAALSGVTVSPGRYVFAGAQPVAGGPGVALTLGANSKFQDLTPLVGGAAAANSDAGEIFVFTDSNYPGMTLPLDLQSAGISFPQAKAGVSAGLNPQITLHGLNADNASLPAELKDFAPVLIWQDQGNTTLKYQPNGLLDVSCGGVCSKILAVPGSQEMVIAASQKAGGAGTNLYGTIYGPRGTWVTIVGILPGDTVAGPLQIISGALQMTLNAKLDMYLLPSPPSRYISGMIE